MTIIGTKFGALDSSAFVSGQPYSAHQLRALASGANRLTAKAQMILSLWWPTRLTVTTAEGAAVAYGNCTIHARPWWTSLLAPITIQKRPGLNRGELRVRAKLESSTTAYLACMSNAISQSAQPISINGDNVLAMAGTGSYANYSLDQLKIGDGEYDQINLWVIGALGAKASEGTYGANNDGSITSLSTVTLVDTSSTWNVTSGWPGTVDLANGGHALSLENSVNARVVSPRVIVGVTSPQSLDFAPALSVNELNRALVGDTYTIYKNPTISFASIALAASARTS